MTAARSLILVAIVTAFMLSASVLSGQDPSQADIRAAVASEIGERWQTELSTVLRDAGPDAEEAFYATAAAIPQGERRVLAFDILRQSPESRPLVLQSLVERDEAGRHEFLAQLREDAAIYDAEMPIPESEARPLVEDELEPAQVAALSRALRDAGSRREADFFDFTGRMPLGDRGNFAEYLLSLDPDRRLALLDYVGSLGEYGRQSVVHGLGAVPVQTWSQLGFLLDHRRADLIQPLFATGRADECSIQYLSEDLSAQVDGSNETMVASENPESGEMVVVCPPARLRGIRMERIELYEAPWQGQLYRSGKSAASYYDSADAKEDRKNYGKPLPPYENRHICGASYIGDGFALTAAHCIGSAWKTKQADFFDGRRVRLGTIDIDQPGSNFAVDSVVVHKAYVSTFQGNDIALIRLASVPSDRELAAAGIRKVDLPRAGTRWRYPATLQASGWGFTGATNSTGDARDRYGQLQHVSQILRMGYLQAFPAAKCEQDPAFVERYGEDFRLRPGQVCAGSDLGVDTCRGDSGGPLVLQRANERILVGIVSFGIGCGIGNRPGVYTEVAHFRRWIDRAKTKVRSRTLVYLR